MSTKKITKTNVLCMLCAIALGFTACKEFTPVKKDNKSSFENMELIIEFQEKSFRVSPKWPSDFHTGGDLQKAVQATQSSSEMWFVEDYSYTEEKKMFDENGYLTFEKEFLNGNGELGLPEEVIKRSKSKMPYSKESENPLTKVTFKDGLLKYLAKDGSSLKEYYLDKETFKVDPSLLSSQDTTRTDNNYQKLIASTTDARIDLSLIGDHSALLNFDNDYNQRVQEVISLKYNRTTYSRTFDTDGKVASESFFNYKMSNGYPVMSVEDTREYGITAKGEWGLKGRTVRNRSNIKVTRNERR